MGNNSFRKLSHGGYPLREADKTGTQDWSGTALIARVAP
jgi:hypothetical protein